MADEVIRVENLGKRYRIGHRERYGSLRESFMRLVTAPFRKAETNGPDHVWALRDVSFEIERGKVVGIIGRNGAGKSTLLKILAQVTEPTEGRVELRGRVGSLLEVGTGFHPELTGRENVFLNGAILGMKRVELTRKFDEIVSFAEVEQFIDTPVKRYSSGMYVRLAFAVAAHLETEILLVDEVLAVGDVSFQKKCLGKIEGVAHEGRTVLFVSHNMASVLALCTKAYLLEHGKTIAGGPPEDVVAEYIKGASGTEAVPLSERTDRNGEGHVKLTSLAIESDEGGPGIRCGDRLRIRIGYAGDRPVTRASFLVGIYDHLNRPIFFLDSAEVGTLSPSLPAQGYVTCVTGPINLTPGPCIVNVAVALAGVLSDHVVQAGAFDVQEDDFFGTGKLTDRHRSPCLLPQRWRLDDEAQA